MSELISWETCPQCGARAAVGWIRQDPVEFDCQAGCSLPQPALGRLFPPENRPGQAVGAGAGDGENKKGAR